MKNNKKRKQLIISIVVVVLAIVLVAGYFVKNAKRNAALQTGNVSLGSGASAESNIVHYKGKTYQYNKNLMNVLFLGIDTTQNLSQTDMPGEAGQSDCILVLSIDKQKKTARLPPAGCPRPAGAFAAIFSRTNPAGLRASTRHFTGAGVAIGEKGNCKTTADSRRRGNTVYGLMKRQTDFCVISEKTHTGMKIYANTPCLMRYRKMIG